MKKKALLVLALASAAALVLAACGKKAVEESSEEMSAVPSSLTSAESSAPEEGSKPEESSKSEESGASPESGTEAFTPSQGQVIIYDPETETASDTTVPTDGRELNEVLVEQLNRTYSVKSGEQEYKIDLNKVEIQDSAIYIDFASGSIPLVGVGSSEESACLRSIAETFLQNYPDADLIYFTVDGGIYSSGHLEFGEGEAFMDRSMMTKS